MSAIAPEPFPTYAHLWDACAYHHKLRVKLHIVPEPEGMNTRTETYLPTVPMADWELGRSYELLGPMTAHHVERALSFFVEVWDGKTLACSGDLGATLAGPKAVTQLRRMAGVLVAQKRVQPKYFPHLRSSDPDGGSSKHRGYRP